MIFPWQQTQWQQLAWLKEANRFPHALLFVGLTGLGKTSFATHVAQALLCQLPGFEFCDQCHACRLVEGGTHPNLLWVRPEKEGQAIKIDQIREMGDFVQQSSLQGEHRFVLMHPADRMNLNAANALLKLLEEPAAGAIIILISDQTNRLPATILSRCQRVVFPTPQQPAALAWLKEKAADETWDLELLLRLANGSPLRAYALGQSDLLALRHDLCQFLAKKSNDLMKLMASLKDMDLISFLDFTLTWVMDLVRLQLHQSDYTLNCDFQNELKQRANETVLERNIELMQNLQQIRGNIIAGINLNKQLVIENVISQMIL